MEKISAFLKRKNIVLSVRRYGIDALGAMAKGLFCSLLIGTILNTVGAQFHIGFLTAELITINKVGYTIGGMASFMSGAAMAVAIGYALQAPPMVLFSLATVGYACNALGKAGGPLAVLFVPAEGVYQYILSDCPDLFDYSLRHHVMITGPGTLTGVLTILGQAQRDWYRAEHRPEIEAGLEKLQEEAARLSDRCEKAERTFSALSDQLHQSAVTSRKMRRKLDELLEGGDLS